MYIVIQGEENRFRNCPYSTSARRLLLVLTPPATVYSNEPRDWAVSYVECLTPAEFAHFMMLGCFIWETRNALYWEGKTIHLQVTVQQAISRLDAFMLVNAPQPKAKGVLHGQMWCPPDVGMLKSMLMALGVAPKR